jgi:N utilization substance protein B
MPAVDRDILRCAALDILYNPEIPPGVATSEAVALAGQLSTDESSGFVNGLLSTISNR